MCSFTYAEQVNVIWTQIDVGFPSGSLILSQPYFLQSHWSGVELEFNQVFENCQTGQEPLETHITFIWNVYNKKKQFCATFWATKA